MNNSQADGPISGGHVATLLPEYLNNTLNTTEREQVVAHLLTCQCCRAELRSWQAVADVTQERFTLASAVPSAATLDTVWAQVDQTPWKRFAQVLVSLRQTSAFACRVSRAQARLIPSGIWVLSSAALLLCFMGMFFWRVGVYPDSLLGAFVPLITAVGMAFIYGPEYDEGLEVTLSTPVSPRLVLLSRVMLVFAFNFAMGLLLTLALVLGHGGDFTILVAYWAGPALLMAGLSLLLSLTISSLTGVACVGVFWLMRFVSAAFSLSGTTLSSGAGTFTEIWKTSPVTLFIAGMLLILAIFCVPYQRRINA